MSRLALRFINVNINCPGYMFPARDECAPWGMQLQIDSALSWWSIAAFKINAMFIKYFKPWAEVIRTRFVTTIFLLNIVYFAICIYKTFRCNESLRKLWSEYESWS